MRILLARLRVGRLRLAAALALIVALVVAIPVIGNLAGSPFESGDGNLVVNGGATGLGQRTQPARRHRPAERPARRLVRQGHQGRHGGSVGRDGSIPNNKSDLMRFDVANERVAGKDSCTCPGSAFRSPPVPRTWTSSSTSPRTSAQRRHAGSHRRRPADPVRPVTGWRKPGVVPSLGDHRQRRAQCQASNTVPCWGQVHSLCGDFEARSTPSPSPLLSRPTLGALSARTFGEAAINLTDSGFLPPGTCNGFGRGYLKSRSSDSFTAAVKDFIRPSRSTSATAAHRHPQADRS